MPSLKAIRTRITSVKSTQKITRAMKMVAGARLARAQSRITALRPYAVKTQEVLAAVVGKDSQGSEESQPHPFLVRRPERRIAVLVLTGDRGLCGAYNTNVQKAAERVWKQAEAEGKTVQLYTVGRKGRDYLRRRQAPVTEDLAGVWDKLDPNQARRIATTLLGPLRKGEIDSIYIIYTQFRSAMSQTVVTEQLLPIPSSGPRSAVGEDIGQKPALTYIFEPNKAALLSRLVPIYVEISILRALLESQASELGARMTAMDSATKNAKEMISSLTLQYNRARQAAITKELMEIVGGAEALHE